MTSTITVEQYREELRAEARNCCDAEERRQIADELRLCEEMLKALEWQAECEERQHQ